jgi:hypothetical protein
MQDNDGNMTMHLVIQARRFHMFCYLFKKWHVNLNLTNAKEGMPRLCLDVDTGDLVIELDPIRNQSSF